MRSKLIAGMSVHEHHGFDPRDVPAVLGRPPFQTVTAEHFELGLNNLYVFRKGP